MDGSPPGSSVHGIFQARVLEWVAIAFSIPKPGQMTSIYKHYSFIRKRGQKHLFILTEQAQQEVGEACSLDEAACQVTVHFGMVTSMPKKKKTT